MQVLDFSSCPSNCPDLSPSTPFPLPPSLPGLSTWLPSSAALWWVWIYWKTSKPNLRRCFSMGWELCPTCSSLKAFNGRLTAVGQSCQGKVVTHAGHEGGCGSNSLGSKDHISGCAAPFFFKTFKRGLRSARGVSDGNCFSDFFFSWGLS